MSDTIERFIKLVNRMEENYKNDTRATGWIMPREMMIALRDELELREFLGQFKTFAKEQADILKAKRLASDGGER